MLEWVTQSVASHPGRGLLRHWRLTLDSYVLFLCLVFPSFWWNDDSFIEPTPNLLFILSLSPPSHTDFACSLCANPSHRYKCKYQAKRGCIPMSRLYHITSFFSVIQALIGTISLFCLLLFFLLINLSLTCEFKCNIQLLYGGNEPNSLQSTRFKVVKHF